MKANHVLAAVAVSLCFTACSKNDGPETLIPAERKSVENLDVTNYGKWTYINLNTGNTNSMMIAVNGYIPTVQPFLRKPSRK